MANVSMLSGWRRFSLVIHPQKLSIAQLYLLTNSCRSSSSVSAYAAITLWQRFSAKIAELHILILVCTTAAVNGARVHPCPIVHRNLR
jgi:hypothetical protein